MEKKCFLGHFAGLEVWLAFRHRKTSLCFGTFLEGQPLPEGSEKAVSVPEEAFREWERSYGFRDNAYTEFDLAVYYTSDALLRCDACIIHAAALYFRGHAWLFAAQSGIGKSTQLRNWMSLYPEGSRIMNGDKPVLRVAEDGTVYVHPSPWHGKEGWGDDSVIAPLGGVILLRQGKENSLTKAEPFLHAAGLFSCFFSTFEKEDKVRGLCRIEDKILLSVPVWELVNTGDHESTELIHEAIVKETENAFSQG